MRLAQTREVVDVEGEEQVALFDMNEPERAQMRAELEDLGGL